MHLRREPGRSWSPRCWGRRTGGRDRRAPGIPPVVGWHLLRSIVRLDDGTCCLIMRMALDCATAARGIGPMRLASVDVSLPRVVDFRGRTVSTSIFKQPVNDRIVVRRLSLEGDWQADLRYHGGLNKAVYAYPLEHYARWSQEL